MGVHKAKGHLTELQDWPSQNTTPIPSQRGKRITTRIMSGSTPYTARSPTQSNQYPPYSPTHPNGPFYSHHEPYHIPSQHLIQTTPPFPPASLVQSPLLNRPSHLASPLSAPNSLPPPPLPPNSHYQVYPTSPSAPHLRSSSAGYPVNPMSVFDGTSTHAHPSAHSPPGQSAIREQHHLFQWQTQ